jgi:hypothetical protein
MIRASGIEDVSCIFITEGDHSLIVKDAIGEVPLYVVEVPSMVITDVLDDDPLFSSWRRHVDGQEAGAGLLV